MLIKKIKLENIRSYVNEEIDLPLGSTLLAGDIGSGKSSILLAVDFALFGIRQGELSGNALLRNGTNEGLVELHFELENNNVVIQRRLKRTQNSVVQDSGYIIMNNERQDKSAIELKQDILNLLNYPKELLTKHKSLIYRYTVYTPQEEMKSILLGEKDARLDTLRKVFDIDKYKRIKENTKIFIANLKQKRRELEGKIYDLEDKKKLVQSKIMEFSEIDLQLKELIPRITQISKLVDEKRKEIKLLEENIKKLNELKKEFELSRFKLENAQASFDKNESELKNLDLKIQKLEKETKDVKIDIDELNEKIDDFNEIIPKNKLELEAVNKKISELETRKLTAMDIISKVMKIDEYENELNENNRKKALLKDKIKQLEADFEILREQKSNYELNKLKLDDLNDKKSKKEFL